MSTIASNKTTVIPSLEQVSLPTYTLPFKLSSDNYMIWKSQILPAIIGRNVENFVNDF